MATERDAGGTERVGLTGMGHSDLHDSNNIGESGSIGGGGYRADQLGDRDLGTGEVPTDLGVNRGAGYSGIAASPAAEDRGVQERTIDRLRQAGDQVRDSAETLQDKVGEVSEQAREQVARAAGRARGVLEEQGVLDQIRENPLPALGIAFGVGFLLAGGGDSSRQGHQSSLNKAMDQLKGAVMGSVTAALATEAKNLLGMAQGRGDQGGMLGGLMEKLREGVGGSTGGTRPPSHQETR